jgi:hypothetical protein
MKRPFLLLSALLCAAPLSAQRAAEPLFLEPGERIRFNAPFPHDARVGARVVTSGPVYLGFSMDGDPSIVYVREFATIDTLEVRRRPARADAARSGALMGVFVGTAAGVISGTLIAPAISMETGTSVALFGSVGSLAGSLAGALTGAAIKPRRWYRFVFVDAPPPLRTLETR